MPPSCEQKIEGGCRRLLWNIGANLPNYSA